MGKCERVWDGVLLGAGTLRGRYPVDTAKTVASICMCEGRKCGESLGKCEIVWWRCADRLVLQAARHGSDSAGA